MMAPLPTNETQRLAVLRDYCILDTPAEPEFDDITTLAAAICNAPVSTITLVDETRQWFKSKVGLAVDHIPREAAICAYLLLDNDLLHVPDMTLDERFAENPLVLGDPKIRFYAGTSLITPTGEKLGSLCVVDFTPRELTDAQKTALRVLARQVMTRMQLRRQIREQQLAEEAIRESEAKFRLLSRATHDGIWDWNLETNELWWSEGFETLFGYTQEDEPPTVEVWAKRIHPEDHDRIMADVQQAIYGSVESWTSEYRFLCKDGSYAHVLDRGHLIHDSKGKAVRMIGGMTDQTETKRAEEQLREQATLLDKAQDAILVRDLDHRILYWNQSAERLYGWTAKEAVGRSIQMLLYNDPTAFLAATQCTMTKGEWTGELQQITKNGDELIVEGHWTLVHDDQGKPKSVLAINTDITDRKRMEQQFLRAQRMESIGTLAGGIAHDLNNVLAPILMSIELLKMQEEDPVRVNILTTIENSAQRGSDMVKQVLSFARGLEGFHMKLGVDHLVTEVENIANDTFPKNIQISSHLPSNLWSVQGDPTQLHQVLLNLCVNARDAMSTGGKLTLSACNAMLDEQYAVMHIEAKPGPHVIFHVEDTGCGMPPEILERVFEPFYTTKELGKGTGLGLSTTLAIVKSHGGFIHVHSEVGKGTRFQVYLPAQVDGLKSEVKRPKNELPRGSGELVLVVDDEASVRQITQQTLEAFGYRVLLASDGTEAVALYAEKKKEIATVLTDMMMPNMDGPTTVQIILRMNSEARIIGASGLNSNGMVTKAANAGVKHFIPKPYTAETLLKTLKIILMAESNTKLEETPRIEKPNRVKVLSSASKRR